MFSFLMYSFSMYMYTLNTNSNTLWKLSKGEKLNLYVIVPGMKVYIKLYNSKSYGNEFGIAVSDGDSTEYEAIPLIKSQKSLEYINFCSSTGKIYIQANQDVEIVVTSVIYEQQSNTNSCKGPITVSYGVGNGNYNPNSMDEDSFWHGFESIFEVLPAISSFIITILIIALLSCCIYGIVSRRTREERLNEAVPPILNSQNTRLDQFDQYIPPTVETTRMPQNYVQPQAVLQPVQYNQPTVLMQYPGAIIV